jgi:hypothetical protein
MMQSANRWQRHEAALLGRLRLADLRLILIQGQMRPPAIVISKETLKRGARMSLTDYNDVVQALATDGTGQPLHARRPPGRAGRFALLRLASQGFAARA